MPNRAREPLLSFTSPPQRDALLTQAFHDPSVVADTDRATFLAHFGWDDASRDVAVVAAAVVAGSDVAERPPPFSPLLHSPSPQLQMPTRDAVVIAFETNRLALVGLRVAGMVVSFAVTLGVGISV